MSRLRFTDRALCAARHPTPTLQVDQFPNPFKIQHHVDCSAAPTLELPLHTTVSGALTIASGPTWTDLAAALQVAMGFKAVGPGVCTGTATLTQTALMHGEAAGSPTLDPPSVSILTWANRAFQTCNYECKYVSVSTIGNVSGFASNQCTSRTGSLTSMTFELALSGYVRYDNMACSGRNEVGSWSSLTYEACQAKCDEDDTCVSFEFQKDGTCQASSSCDFARSIENNNGGYQLFVKKGGPPPTS